MKLQLTEDVGESQTSVDQDDSSVLPGITLKPYGIENIELGHPAGVLNTETGEVNIVTVNGVAIEKIVCPQIIGSAVTELSSILSKPFDSSTNSFIKHYDDTDMTRLMDIGNLITIPTNLNTNVATSTAQLNGDLVYATRNRDVLVLSDNSIDVTTGIGAPFESELSLRFLLDNIIARAEKAGFVITVDLVPNKPLAMGNYNMVPTIRRKDYR